MPKWSRKEVDPNTINNGNELDSGSQVAVQELNSIVNSGLFAQDFAKYLASQPDNSEANNVGTANVQLVPVVIDGQTYYKFKFLNLKGEQGVQGERGTDGEQVQLRVENDIIQWKYENDTEWISLISVADLITIDKSLSTTSENPVQNKIITNTINNLDVITEFVVGETSWYLKTKGGFWLCGMQCGGVNSTAKKFNLPLTHTYGKNILILPAIGQKARMNMSVAFSYNDVIDDIMGTFSYRQYYVELRSESTNAYNGYVICGGNY
ncbi:MAG: hypothetical protein ACI4PF_01070 [Christensenellales bacterium]